MVIEEIQTENSEEQKVITSSDIMDSIIEGSQLYTEATENFIKEFVFYDKTLYDWASDLMVDIPMSKDLDPEKYRDILLTLAQNIQIASNYFSVASSMVDAISGGSDVKKSSLINEIVNNYARKGAKRPAATVIDQMADSYLNNGVSASIAAKIVINFWKQRLDTLLDIRKVFEQIGMSLHVELKITST
jgi:hypothetical protein